MQKERNFKVQLDQFYHNDLKRFIFTLTRNNEAMDEILQNTIAAALEKQQQLKSEAAIKSWLFSIAKSEINQYYRKHPPVITLEDYQSESEELSSSYHLQKDISDLLQQIEDTAFIRSAIHRLEIKYQQVILLHYYEDLSLKEISKLLNVNYPTIKTLHKRALEQLKKQLLTENGDAF